MFIHLKSLKRGYITLVECENCQRISGTAQFKEQTYKSRNKLAFRALRLIYTSEVDGDGSGNGCVKEAEQKISFFVSSLSPLTSVTSSVNRLNGSGDGDATNQPIKILEKY